ncbi:MAG TPA: AraC family transcriptional regulator ligand-binding domain-containing protein [Cellvibrio sp.]
MNNNSDELIAEVDACYQPAPYFEIDTPFIPAHEWPSTLIDIALTRGIEEHKLLRNTGIFREDIATEHCQLAPQQCFQLINNLQKYFHNHEPGFLLGHDLFTQIQTPAAAALNTATNLQAALDILIDQQTRLMPLLDMRCRYEQDNLVIYWQDAYGADSSMVFLLEMMCTTLSSLARWHCDETVPWQFHFTHSKPTYIEQYDVHLGNRIQFSSHLNAMSVARNYLYVPWKHSGSAPQENLVKNHHIQQPSIAIERGFLREIYNYLYHNIHHNPNLDKTAAAFGMSSASLKRKLKKHHSHFQEQYDLVRKDLALYWLNQVGCSKEQVAQKLHFYDVANLRRAFKKWTGSLPPSMERRG